MTSVPFAHVHPDAATLGAYHDGELRGFVRTEVETHLASCPRCRRELSEIEALAEVLRSLPTVEPPAETHAAVLARVAGTRPQHRARRITWQLAAIVAAALALGGGFDLFALQRAALPTASPPALMGQKRTPAIAPQTHGKPSFGLGQQGSGRSAHNAVIPPAAAHRGMSVNGATASPLVPGSRATRHAPATTAPPTTLGRLIVHTGEVDMQVPNVQRAFSAVTLIASRQGGYVSDSNSDARAATGGMYAATLTLRVPAANFQPTLDAVAVLPHGKLTERSTSQDITDSYHDLQASLQALQTTRAQLTALMRQSHSVHDAITVLDRITQINTDIDSVQGQIMAGANSVALSAVAVNLTPEPAKHHVVPPVHRRQPPQHHASGWQPGRDLASALDNLLLALQAIITVAIYAVVYLAVPLLLAAMLLLTRSLWRRMLLQ